MLRIPRPAPLPAIPTPSCSRSMIRRPSAAHPAITATAWTSHVEKAHGHDEHWLWPLFPHANVEAGCQQCHATDMVLPHAPVLTAGKDLFQWRGCVGCHRFQGYDSEPED